MVKPRKRQRSGSAWGFVEHFIAAAVLAAALLVTKATVETPTCDLPPDEPWCAHVCVGKEAVCEFRWDVDMPEVERLALAKAHRLERKKGRGFSAPNREVKPKKRASIQFPSFKW